MFLNNYFLENRKGEFELIRSSNELTRIDPKTPSKRLPLNLMEIEMFRKGVTDDKAKLHNNLKDLSWLISFQKEVQIEAEMLSLSRFANFYLEQVGVYRTILVDDQNFEPDFIYRGAYRGKNGFIVEFKTRNARLNVDTRLRVEELEKLGGNLTMEEMDKIYSIKKEQTRNVSKYCERMDFYQYTFVVTERQFHYGAYYNACLALISKELSKRFKDINRNNIKLVLSKRYVDLSFLDKFEGKNNHLELAMPLLEFNLGIEKYQTLDDSREFDKKQILDFLPNLKLTKDIVNRSKLNVSNLVSDYYGYLHDFRANINPFNGTNYTLNCLEYGERRACKPLIYLPFSELGEPSPLISKDYSSKKRLFRVLYLHLLFFEQNEDSYKKYSDLNKTIGELNSNQDVLEREFFLENLTKAEADLITLTTEMNKKAKPFGMEVNTHCYLKYKEGIFKERDWKKGNNHIDYREAKIKDYEQIFENIYNYLKESKVNLAEMVEFENPLTGLPSSMLGKLYAKLGSDFINILQNDETWRYLLLVNSIIDQFLADTKASIAREKVKSTVNEKKIIRIAEWCKITRMKYVPLIIISSSQLNDEENGFICICNYSERNYSKVENYLYQAEYLECEKGFLRVQLPMRMHPQVTSTFHEYLCAYAGDVLHYYSYNYKLEEILYIKTLYWTINRMIVRFSSHIYLTYQKATLEMTMGNEDMKTELSGLVMNDIRLAFYVKRLVKNYPKFVRNLRESIDNKSVDFDFKDPIFGLKIKDIQVHLGLVNIKQMFPKADGYNDNQIKRKFICAEATHSSWLDNSNFSEHDLFFHKDMTECFEMIFRKQGLTYPELQEKTKTKLNKYHDFVTHNPTVIAWGLKSVIEESFKKDDLRKHSNIPFTSSYWARNTPNSVNVPYEYCDPNYIEEKMKENSSFKKERESQNWAGFLPMKVPEATINIVALLSSILEVEMHQIMIADAISFFEEKYSIVFCNTKEQKEVGKRIFFITTINNRISYIALDESFQEILKRNKYDVLTKPGEKKFLAFERKMIDRFRNHSFTIVTLDATKFGDTMSIVALQITVFLLYKLGYYTKQESEWANSVLESLKKRFLVLPKGFIKVMEKIRKSDPDQYSEEFATVLEYMQDYPNVRKFFEEACADYTDLKVNKCLFKKVGFILGVFNRLGTLMSVMIGTLFCKIMNSIFPGIDADWATLSDDAMGIFCLYDTLDLSVDLTDEIIERLIENLKIGKVMIPDSSRRNIIDGEGKVVFTYSEVSMIMWGILFLLYKSMSQNISMKKSGQGFTGEVTQCFLGFGRAISCTKKQKINLGSTLQFFSPFEDLMSMMGSVYSSYVLGASMTSISNMFYLCSYLIKVVYRINVIRPMGFKNPFWGPPEMTLSFWMLPEAIRYTGFSGKERLHAMYIKPANILIDRYKNMSKMLIDTGAYFKTSKVDVETKETKAVTTNRVHLYIMTLNKLKTKKVFFQVLREKGPELIRSIVSDIPQLINYGVNIGELLQNLAYLRSVLKDKIVSEEENNLYIDYRINIKEIIELSLTKEDNIEKSGSKVLKRITRELTTLMIIGYPKNYIKLVMFLNKYLSRGFQLSYNKLSKASQIKSRLGFLKRTNMHFFNEDNVPPGEYNYEPKELNNTQICKILWDMTRDISIIDPRNENLYNMEYEFHFEKIDFYRLIVTFVNEQPYNKLNFELDMEWTEINSVIGTNLFYFDIKDILTYILEVIIRKITNPVLFELKPEYRNLETFSSESLRVFNLLLKFGFNESLIVANFNSICQTLNYNVSPKTMRLMVNKDIMSQTQYNHSYKKMLNWDIKINQDYQFKRSNKVSMDTNDDVRFALMIRKDAKYSIFGDVRLASVYAADLMTRIFYFRNFHFWLISDIIKFAIGVHENEIYFFIFSYDNFIGLKKVVSKRANSTFKLITNMPLDKLQTIEDACLSITKYVSDSYGDLFVSLKRNIFKSREADSNVSFTEKGITTSITRGSHVWIHQVNREQIKQTHYLVKRESTMVLVTNENKKEKIMNYERPIGKFYVLYPNLMLNPGDGFNMEEEDYNGFDKSRLFDFTAMIEYNNAVLPFLELAMILNIGFNNTYPINAYDSKDDWILAAWLYMFDFKIKEVVRSEDYSDILMARICLVLEIDTIDETVGHSKKFVEHISESKNVNLQHELAIKLWELGLSEQDNPISIVMELCRIMPQKDFPYHRFASKSIYERTTRKTLFTRIKVRESAEKLSFRQLFDSGKYDTNWVFKYEYYKSKEDLIMGSYSLSEEYKALISFLTSDNVKLILFGNLHIRVFEFLQLTTNIDHSMIKGTRIIYDFNS